MSKPTFVGQIERFQDIGSTTDVVVMPMSDYYLRNTDVVLFDNRFQFRYVLTNIGFTAVDQNTRPTGADQTVNRVTHY